MKRLILAVFCAVVTFVCPAQNNRVVNGAVFTADGAPLSAVVLKAVGTELAFTPGADGRFQIQVPYYVKMIEASAEGYLTEQAEIDGSYMVFKLKVDKKYLENKAKADEAARVAAIEKAKAEAAAKLAAEKDALAKAKAEAAAKAKAEEDARKAAEAKAKEEAAAKLAAEKEALAKAKAEEAARIAAIEKAKADSIANVKAAKRQARLEEMNKYNKQYRNKGLVHNFELNYSYPLTGANKIVYQNYGVREFSTLHPVEFNYSIGYRFCNWVSVSLGTGVTYDLVDLRNYGDKFSSVYEVTTLPEDARQVLNYSNISIPVFLNAKYYMTKGKVQPMLSVSGGIYLPLPSVSLQNMWLFDAGVGCNFRLSKRSNMYVMASVGTVPAVLADIYDFYGQEHLWAWRNAVLAPRIKIGFTL